MRKKQYFDPKITMYGANNVGYFNDAIELKHSTSDILLADTKVVQTFSGIVMSYCDFKPSKTERLILETTKDFVEFSFHISGAAQSKVINDVVGTVAITVDSGQSMVSLNTASTFHLNLEAGERYQVLNLYMAPSDLDRFLGGISPNLYDLLSSQHRKRRAPFFHTRKYTPQIQTLLDQMQNCHYQNAAKKLYQESKILELIACALWQFEEDQTGQRSVPDLSETDVSKLEAARQIIIQQIREPLSLGELSRVVGLSEKRLKRGFKIHY